MLILVLYVDAKLKSGSAFCEDKSNFSSTTDRHDGFIKKKVKMSLYSLLRQRPAGGVEVYLHLFLTSTLALDRVEWSVSRPGRFILGKMHRWSLNRRRGVPQNILEKRNTFLCLQ
jgi:hypothetical protein